jgi:hypothetical protein
MANWLRSPLTHFEKWAASIRILLPSFFEKEEPDFDQAAEDVTTLRGLYAANVESEKNLLKRIKARDAFLRGAYHIADFMKDGSSDFDVADGKRNKALSLLQKAIKLQEEEDNKAKESGDATVDGAVPRIEELINRSDRLREQSNYLANGPFSDHKDQMAEILIFLHDFNWCGRKLFRMEEQITHELALTNIEGVSAEFLKLPYQTICVHSPFNETVRINDHPIKWSYLSEYQEEDGRHIHVMYVRDDEQIFIHEFIFQENAAIGAQIKAQITDMYGKQAAKDNLKAFSMVASLILYMNSSERDVRMMNPRVLMPKLDSRMPVCSVGGTIRVDRSLHMSADGGGEHTIHILKWTVRGHFRNQVCGPQRSERRITWVRPHLKGRERANEHMPARPSDYVLS